MTTGSLRVKDVAATVSAAFDLGELVDPGQVVDVYHWRAGVERQRTIMLGCAQTPAFQPPRIARSAYAGTPRAYRATIVEPYRGHTLPVEFELATKSARSQGCLTVTPWGVRIFPNGALIVRTNIVTSAGKWVTPTDLVTDFNASMRLLGPLCADVLDEFRQIWPKTDTNFELLVPAEVHSLMPAITYETIDATFGITSARVTRRLSDFKDIFRQADGGDPDAIRLASELVAIGRMSEAALASHNNARLSQFALVDLGYRQDEYWVVGQYRLLRSHPDRASPNVAAFWADVGLASDSVLSQRATRNFLRQWLSISRRKLVDQLAAPESLTKQRELLQAVSDSALLALEPVQIRNTSRHEFFRRIVDAISEATCATDERGEAKESLDTFAKVLETHSSQALSDLNIKLQAVQVRLGRIAIWIAVLSVAIATLSLVSAMRKDGGGEDQPCGTETEQNTSTEPNTSVPPSHPASPSGTAAAQSC